MKQQLSYRLHTLPLFLIWLLVAMHMLVTYHWSAGFAGSNSITDGPCMVTAKPFAILEF
jgi:hypothetical protein